MSSVSLGMQRIIFFDGVCPLCNHFVDFVIKRDQRGLFLFSSLQSAYAKDSLPLSYQGLDTIVLKENDEIFVQSTAVLRVLFQLGPGWNVFAVFTSIIPCLVRDFFYQIVAKNRYQILGQNKVCRLPTSEEKKFFLD